LLLPPFAIFNFDFSFNFGHFGNLSPLDFCSCLIYQAPLPNGLGNYMVTASYFSFKWAYGLIALLPAKFVLLLLPSLKARWGWCHEY